MYIYIGRRRKIFFALDIMQNAANLYFHCQFFYSDSNNISPHKKNLNKELQFNSMLLWNMQIN